MAVIFQLKTGEGIPSSLKVGEPAFDTQNNKLYIGDNNGKAVEIETGAVSSVNEKVGDVVLKAEDIGAYSKEEIDSKLSSVYKYKGTIDYYFQLPTNAEVGDVYNIRYASGENYYTETKLYYDYSVDSSSELPPFSDYGLEGLAVIIPMSLNDFNNLKAQGDTVIVDISVDYRFEIPIRDSCPVQATSCLCRLDDSHAFLIIVSTEEPFNQGTLYLSIKGYLENEKPPFRFNESVDIYPSEPYLINDGDNVAWTGTEWDVLSGGLSKTEVNELIDSAIFKKANKATTLSGYGITDAYTKTEVDELIRSLLTRIETLENA